MTCRRKFSSFTSRAVVPTQLLEGHHPSSRSWQKSTRPWSTSSNAPATPNWTIRSKETDVLVEVRDAVIVGGGDAGTYNSTIPALVKARADAGKHIGLVDMYTAFVNTPNYVTVLMHDDLHPSDTGYKLMGDVWYPAVKPFLP